MTETKIKLKSKLAYLGAGVMVGMVLLAGLLALFSALTPGQSVGFPVTPLKGVFYGQVVDAFTLDPIPNATVHLCSGKSLDDLVTTVITNASGYYGTTNITLSEAGTFYVSAEASGYYTEPLGPSANSFSDYETASEIAPFVYSISPIKLYSISSDARMAVEIFPKSGGLIIVDKSYNYTYQLLNEYRIDFDIIMWNHQLNTAAGSPYYGNELQIVTNDSAASIYPTANISTEASLISVNAVGVNPLHIEHFTINFGREGLTRITLLLKENPYPNFYNFRQHLSLEFTFWVNVTWS
jgi:hypothetical protein